MANQKQLAVLKQGAMIWNNWRKKNPNDKIGLIGASPSGADLESANLYEADLRRAHFNGVNLTRAKLNGANLTRANLNGANLNEAIFSEANLIRSNLIDADFSRANLIDANLDGADLMRAHLNRADLIGANLHTANLSGADLTEAIIGFTSFDAVDLSQVKGLETVKHQFPSTIGIDTIYKSKGNIPEVFLRGCGVPDNFITFMHSLAGRAKAFDFYSCFISYSSKDEDLAKRLYNDLQGQGVRCWFAPEHLKIGDKFPERIDEAIHVYDKLMLLLSNHSINSSWVRKEVRTALGKEKQQNRTVLFPIRLDDEFMDTTEDWADEIRRTRHTGDFRNWKDHDSYQKAFARLLRDLQTETAKS